MYDQVRLYARGLAIAVALTVSSAAGAATLNISTFDPSDLSGALAAVDALRKPGEASVSENFEDFTAWKPGAKTWKQNPTTAVGTFTSIGGEGQGSSVIGDATKLQVRGDAPMAWNRINTGHGGNNWLDSNDTHGMEWDVGGMPSFDALSFILTDVADQGGKFSIQIGDQMFSEVLGASGRLVDGGIYVVSILLPEAVSSLSVLLHNDTLKDGFGIDNIHVALQSPSPVPLPPAALLIVAGMGSIAMVRRRRSTEA